MQPSQRIDVLNIFLMLASFAFALWVPFEAFLFSYAVLGPLHYLTEISWLNQRDFFMHKRRHVAFLVLVCFVLSAQTIYVTLYGHRFSDTIVQLFHYPFSPGTLFLIQVGFGTILFLSFFVTLALIKTKKINEFYSWLALIVFIAVAAQFTLPHQYALFSLMLPTIIHVSVFTAMFVLSGALKQKHVLGYAVFFLYLVICALFFIPGIFLPVADHITPYAMYSYNISGFPLINRALLGVPLESNDIDIYRHPFGLRVQAFIAFAYTYHYLNWFSKTGFVGWHRISRARLAFIILAWIGVIGIYAYDYRLGLAVLLFFSLLHVVLEFPLNHKVMGQILGDLKGALLGKFR